MEHMNESRLALVVGLALVIAWLVVRSSRSRWVHSDVTGRSYRVLDLPDAQEAADALASLELAAEQFLTDAESVAPGDPRLANVRERWSRRLREIDGSDNIAYTVTKRDVSLCVRRPGGGAVYDDPRSGMFVLLHELAHVANDGWGARPDVLGRLPVGPRTRGPHRGVRVPEFRVHPENVLREGPDQQSTHVREKRELQAETQGLRVARTTSGRPLDDVVRTTSGGM